MLAFNGSHRSMRCPNCQSSRSVKRLGEIKPISSYGFLFFFSPFLAIFHRASTPSTYECQSCRQVFHRPNRAAQIAVALFFLLIVAGFLYAIFDGQISLPDREKTR